MYKCLKENVNSTIEPEKPYEINDVKIRVKVGSSSSPFKTVDLVYFPSDINYNVRPVTGQQENFTFSIQNNTLTVRHMYDRGWDNDLYCHICVNANERLFLFPEQGDAGWAKSYVSYKGKKILDCRDPTYIMNKGWNARRPVNKKKIVFWMFLLLLGFLLAKSTLLQ